MIGSNSALNKFGQFFFCLALLFSEYAFAQFSRPSGVTCSAYFVKNKNVSNLIRSEELDVDVTGGLSGFIFEYGKRTKVVFYSNLNGPRLMNTSIELQSRVGENKIPVTYTSYYDRTDFPASFRFEVYFGEEDGSDSTGQFEIKCEKK
jgi:hypothetical protein